MRNTINTERLVLRPIGLGDVSELSKLGGAKSVAPMTAMISAPFPELSAEFWIMQKCAQARRGLSFAYAVTLGGGELLGVVELTRAEVDATLELSYWLGAPYWGHGYMIEACRALIREAGERLGAERISAGVFADNPKSLRLLRKLGFTAAQSYEAWFSMARMEKARGVTLTLELSSLNQGEDNRGHAPLPFKSKLVMRA